MDKELEVTYGKLLSCCTEYLATTQAIDTELISLDVNMDSLNQANSELEALLSLEANALSAEQNLAPNRRIMVAGATKLRWLLDGETTPIFDKMDEQVALTYRRKLLQYYHPDRSTGDESLFNMANAAYATPMLRYLGC